MIINYGLATDKTVEYCKEHPAGKAGAFFMIGIRMLRLRFEIFPHLFIFRQISVIIICIRRICNAYEASFFCLFGVCPFKTAVNRNL
jgi:hypothetical protein